MRILFLCGRELGYSRNSVIFKALKEAGYDITLCVSDKRSTPLRYLHVLGQFLLKRWKGHDLIYVGFFGQPLVPLVRLYAWRSPIVFDAFLSAYDTLVFDKATAKPGSLKAKMALALDKISCDMASLVLLDTDQHIEYFAKHIGVPRKKLRRLFISADEDIFKPSPAKKGGFVVEFHGGFIPLQGTEYIMDAAARLKREKIGFRIIGSGQTFEQAKQKAAGLPKVSFLGQMPIGQVAAEISSASIGLGIFGKTDKAARVIPNKAFEILASARPLITADTPAARELLTHGKDAYLCARADGASLAKAIMALKKDSKLRARIAKGGAATFKKRASRGVIAEELKVILAEAVHG